MVWPMDRFTSLVLFTRIVEAGSLSAAAREANVSQPTVSKQLADLEARLGRNCCNGRPGSYH